MKNEDIGKKANPYVIQLDALKVGFSYNLAANIFVW